MYYIKLYLYTVSNSYKNMFLHLAVCNLNIYTNNYSKVIYYERYFY